MGAQVDSQTTAYIIHDRRSLPGQDAVYRAAIELTDEIMEGLGRLTHSHSLMAATLFITNRGAQLILMTKSFETEPMNNAMDSILKRVIYDEIMGNLYTYAIPILEVTPGDDITIDMDNFDLNDVDGS